MLLSVGTAQQQSVAHPAKIRRTDSTFTTREVVAENEDCAEQVRRPIKKYSTELKLYFPVRLP